MDENEKLNITLHIYDTSIPVSIKRSQEESFRKAASMINEKLNAYFGRWKGVKSEKEICYFAMIDIALKCVDEAGRNDVSPITDILSSLSEEINKVLKG